MIIFNRAVAIFVWLLLLALFGLGALAPFNTINQFHGLLTTFAEYLRQQQAANPANFVIGQATVGIVALLLFGGLTALEIWSGRRRGVRIRTAEGGSAEMDTTSISRRLEWQLDQVAEIIAVVPSVKSKRGSVDIKLEIEAAPDIDVPMKTDEVVEVTRDIIEQDMGLRLGKLDVHMRYAPYEPEWAA